MSGYPYATEALARLHDDGRWEEIAPRCVPARDLRPTQPDVSIARLCHHADGGAPETGDPYPHVVSHEGTLWVHDGHHRWVLKIIAGARVILARVVDESGQAA